jgi:DNA-binding response OmpR family regulator
MPIKVLIVEPDAATRAGFVQALTLGGFDIVEAITFHEARQTLQDQRPGVLVTEIRLSEFNGLQLILTNRHPIPSVLVARADPVLQAEARRLGAAYLTKPVSQADLLAAIERQLATYSPADAAVDKRRWIRKPVTAALQARIDDFPGRVVDVSYGGLRVEVDRASESPLPRLFSVTLPSARLDFPAHLVWCSRLGARSWRCGMTVSPMGQTEASTWRGLVDTIG